MIENERSKFEDLLNNYIIADLESDSNPTNFHRTFGNDEYVYNFQNDNTNFITNVDSFKLIVNEKNQLIEELKCFSTSLKEKYENEFSKKDLEINSLKLKCKNYEEKIRILESKNKSQIIDYYESQIKKLLMDYNNSFNIFKNNMDQIDSSFLTNCTGTQKQVTSLKSVINSLLKQNEQLNEDLSNLKKIDRMNHVYKNLINKFAVEIENNKKEYEVISKNQVNYVKILEDENKNLKSLLQEDKNKPSPKKCDCYENKVFQNIPSLNSDRRNISHSRSNTHFDSYSSRYQSLQSFQSDLDTNKNYINFKSFSKILTSSKIILNDKTTKLKDLNDAILVKLESLNFKQNSFLHSIRMIMKKLIHSANEIIEMIITEILHLNSQSYNNYKLGIILQNIIREIFNKYENLKTTRNISDYEEFMEKINKYVYSKFKISFK